MQEYQSILDELINELIDIIEGINSTYISKLDCVYTQNSNKVFTKKYTIEIQKVEA